MTKFANSLSLVALVLAVLCALGLLTSGLGVRADFWDFRTGFSILKWSVYLLVIPVALAIISCLLSKGAGRKPVIARCTLALLISIVVFAVPYSIREEFRKIPTISDISTDIENVPEFVDLVSAREATATTPLSYRGAEAAELQRQYFSELTTIATTKSPAEIINQAKQLALQLGFENIIAKPEDGRFEASQTSFWFGFKDDLVVRAKANLDGTTLVDIRSASRDGKLDGGVNGKRVAQFHKALNN